MPAPKVIKELIDRFDRNLAAARTEHEQTALQRHIDATDGQIDGLVYELEVYPAEPRRMVWDGGRLTEKEAILEWD